MPLDNVSTGEDFSGTSIQIPVEFRKFINTDTRKNLTVGSDGEPPNWSFLDWVTGSGPNPSMWDELGASISGKVANLHGNVSESQIADLRLGVAKDMKQAGATDIQVMQAQNEAEKVARDANAANPGILTNAARFYASGNVNQPLPDTGIGSFFDKIPTFPNLNGLQTVVVVGFVVVALVLLSQVRR